MEDLRRKRVILIHAKAALKLMIAGIKIRNVTVSQISRSTGLKGRTAKALYNEVTKELAKEFDKLENPTTNGSTTINPGENPEAVSKG